MLAGSAVFAVMAALTHAAGSRCDWRLIAFARALFMFGAAVVLARAGGVKLALSDPPSLWMRSLAGSFSLVCNFYAMTRLPIADAITLSNVYPLWILLATAFVAREPPALGEILGVACGLAGVALIEQPHFDGDRAAAILALLGSVGTSVAMFGLHRLRTTDPRAIVAHFAGVATVAVAVCLLFPGPKSSAGNQFDWRTAALLLGVGITGTIGQFLLTKAYSAGPPTRVAVVGLSQVVFALGFDVWLWNRAFSAATLCGFVLVLAPAAWLSGRASRRIAGLFRAKD